MRVAFILFIFLNAFAVCFAQSNRILGRPCHYTVVEDSTIDVINKRSVAIPSQSDLNKIIRDICNKVFNGINLSRKVIIKTNSFQNAASAYPYNEDDNSTKVYISLNDQKIKRFFATVSQQNAVLIFVLAHELNHIVSSDILEPPDSRYNNYENELQSDEIAGLAVSLLTNEDMSFFNDAMKRIVGEGDSLSFSHPSTNYRILAAKAGWLRGKFTSSANDQNLTIRGYSYAKKYYPADHVIEIGAVNSNNEFNDFIYQFSDTSSDIKVYFSASGEWKIRFGINDQKNKYIQLFHYYNAKNTDLFTLNSSWSSQDYFDGQFFPSFLGINKLGVYCDPDGKYVKEGEMSGPYLLNGWGKWDKNGELYIGNWRNDKLNGYGVHIRKDKTIEKGIWKDDVLIKKE